MNIFHEKGDDFNELYCVKQQKHGWCLYCICGFSMEKMNPEKIKHVDMLQRKSEGYNAVGGDKSLHVA